MITRCLCCGNWYWRYREDFPPALFCSFPCAERARALAPPFTADEVLSEMLLHLRMEHVPRDRYHQEWEAAFDAEWFGKNPLLFAEPAGCDECWELELLREVAV